MGRSGESTGRTGVASRLLIALILALVLAVLTWGPNGSGKGLGTLGR